MNVTEILAENIVDFPLDEIPEAALREARRSFLNWLGVSLGAANHPSVDILIRLAEELGGNPQASILGRNLKTNMYYASLINGTSSHIFDFDDTLLNTVLHPSAPVLPALLAVAEYHDLTAFDLLASFVVGCEVEQRIALTICPSHYRQGWHITGTAGVLGAAGAVGKMLGLNKGQLINALGLASTQPTGFREMFGSMTKPFHPGKAAGNGLFSALLAQKGFTSSPHSLEAARGFCRVTSEDPDFAYLTKPWENSWLILENTYKPYACGIVTHPGIEAASRLKKIHRIDPRQIKNIKLDVHPLVLELTGKQEPANHLAAKFSIYHCVAAGMIFGNAGEEQFADHIVNSPEVIALRRKVRATLDSRLKEDQARLVAELTDGTIIEEFVEHVVGSKENPMSNEQLEEKFREITKTGLDFERQNSIISAIWEMDRKTPVRTIIALCQ
ncbi:MAG: MmgE/PrpD family protein [Peptococcaceae bacterium]